MKKTIAISILVLAAAVSATTAMAKDGGGGSIRMEPFNGDVNKATPREQQSIYYQMAKRQADAKAAKAAEVSK